MADTLHVEQRTKIGKRNNRKLRQSGRLPAVLYGHGEESVSLTVPADEFSASLRHGAKIVELDGAVSTQALLQDVQWDTFCQHVLHVDFLRVVAGEKITVAVTVETRGVAPGANDGVVEQLLHEVEIEVTPAHLPEKLHVNINSLELGGVLTVGDIEDLPAEATMLTDSSETIVHCIERAAEPEEEETPAGEAEPEVIGQKDQEEESESES